MEEVTLETKTVQFDVQSNKLWVINARLANILNKSLKQYDKGNYLFQAGEEAIFLLSQIELKGVRQTIKSFTEGRLHLPKGKGEL